MATSFKPLVILACWASFFWAATAYGQQTAPRVKITAISPSVFTGQDYSPWLNDDLNNSVQEVWMPINSQYIDVTLKLEQQTNVTQVRLYDCQGNFTDNPATIYALYGTQRVLLGKFTGEQYLQWVDMPVIPAVPADAIIVHKIGNNIPQKIQVFGQATGTAPSTSFPTQVQSVINFGALGTKTVGSVAFELIATSNNTGAPITFASANPGVVAVSNSTGKWMATAIAVGTATITASQAANASFTAAANVAQPITVQPAPTVSAPAPTTSNGIARERKLRQQFGVNAFEWDLEDPNRPWEVDATRLPAVKKFNGIRHYLDWERLEAKEGSYTFSPSYQGGWGYDEMYTRLKTEGVEVLACIKTVPTWILASWPEAERDSENVPVRYGNDFGKPGSYIEQAKLAFQFAARYGSNPNVSPSLLSVNSTPRWTGDGINQVKIGLSLIQYMECDNERDKWWKGSKAKQSPAQYAANLSAYYDGHKNTMGPGVGVKNADPNMQVVMAGLAAPDPNYVKGMIEWCRQNRGYKADGSVNLCWDVINYHVYSNNDNCSQTGTSTRGQAPELSGAAIIGQSFMQMARDYAGSMPVWVTETGFDTNQGSPLKAIAIGNRSVVETQADWTLRTSLMYARLGIERNFFYQLYDDNPGSSQQFATMGLTNADRTPRLATQYLNQTNQLLGEYSFKETLNADPLVDRYELNGTSAYALVVPDEKGRTAQYVLNLGTAAYADVYRPISGAQTMTPQRVTVQNGQLTLQVTETPMFVVVSGAATTPTPTPAPTPTPTPVPAICSATGTILREQWNNITGKNISGIPVQNIPASTSQLTIFESNRNVGNNYGARIRGYICAPQTGNYTFWIAGDEVSELYISSDDDPAKKKRIASASGATGWRVWNKYASQQSAPVALVAGRRYYVEVMHKEQVGDDYVSVAWQLPSGAMEGPIPGRYLSPFVPSASLTATSSANAVISSMPEQKISMSAAQTTLVVFPMPITYESMVELTLAKAGKATIEVLDLQGRRLQPVYSGALEAGVSQQALLKAANLPMGTYILRLTTETEVLNQRIVVAK